MIKWILMCFGCCGLGVAAGPVTITTAIQTAYTRSIVNFEDQAYGLYTHNAPLLIQSDQYLLTFTGVGGPIGLVDATNQADMRQAFGRAFGQISLTTDTEYSDICGGYAYAELLIDPPVDGDITFKMVSAAGDEDEPPLVRCFTTYDETYYHLAGEIGPSTEGYTEWPSNVPWTQSIGYDEGKITVCHLYSGVFDQIEIRTYSEK